MCSYGGLGRLMRNRICRAVLGVSSALGVWWAPPVLAQAPSAAAAQIGLSPDARRVIDTYSEIMTELQAQMAGGGRQTERMTVLERRLAAEVKAAATELFAVVRDRDYESANAAAYALKYAPEPKGAVSALLVALDRFDGKMTNNIGLTLEHLCMEHPTLEVPTAPLTRALQAREWTHQQKVAQVVQVLVQRGGVTDPDGTLAAALIPMLASQRVRVFAPARQLLPTITARSLGNAPSRGWRGTRKPMAGR
jgi:hypothetical protein